jgi:hypothetical protein
MKANKIERPSTFEREMQDPAFQKLFNENYNELLLSELLIALMEKDAKSVRALARAVKLSPTVIQKIRSGQQGDIKLGNFLNISQVCGYHLVLEKGKERIPLDGLQCHR